MVSTAKHMKIIEILKLKPVIASSIMLISLAGVFLVGSCFDLFGNRIDFSERPTTFLFFGFMITAAYGALYTALPKKAAFFGSMIVALIFLLLFLLGKLSRGEI